jgi:zinc protease
VLLTSRYEWEPYALAVLAGVLDAGQSSRLSQRLVRSQELAASASASYDLYARYENLFLLDATPAAGRKVTQLEQALYKEIKALRTELVRPSELERVKAQVVASEVYGQDSLMTQASNLGALETVGLGWKTLARYVERIKAVTPDQVREVARKYLINDHKTVAVLEPMAINGKQAAGVLPQPSGELR